MTSEKTAPENKGRRGTGSPPGLAGEEGWRHCAPSPLPVPEGVPTPSAAWGLEGGAVDETGAADCHALPAGRPRPFTEGNGPRALSLASLSGPSPCSAPWEADVHGVPEPRPAYPKGLGGRRDPEDINKYGRTDPGGSWPHPGWAGKPGPAIPEGPPPPSVSLISAPGGHDPVVGCVSSPLAPQEAGGACAGRACP